MCRAQLGQIYGDFEADAKELTQKLGLLPSAFQEIRHNQLLGTEEKIALFTRLQQENKKVESMLNNKDPQASRALEKLFGDWAEQVVRMRLIQEFETIKGLLVTAELAKTVGVPALEAAMAAGAGPVWSRNRQHRA